MPHYANGETYIEISEPQAQRIFDSYSGPIAKSSHERIRIISDDLGLDPERAHPSSIIRI